MSEITTENHEPQAELENQELTLEQKIENHSIEEQLEAAPQSEDFDKVLRKKNQLLNEKKKVQSENAELKRKYNELMSTLKRQEEEKLEEKQEYKKLWETTQEELRQERTKRLEQEEKIVRGQKRKAFDRELGKPLANDRYYDFVAFDEIIVEEDGLINSESVRYAVNKFRANYSELVPVTHVVRTGSEAPSNDGIVKTKKGLNEMQRSDRSNLKRKLLSKNR